MDTGKLIEYLCKYFNEIHNYIRNAENICCELSLKDYLAFFKT